MSFGTGNLVRNSTGDGVLELQQWLQDRGFLFPTVDGAPTLTGTFDEATEHAVKAFKLSAGVPIVKERAENVTGTIDDDARKKADAFASTAEETGWHPTAKRWVVDTIIGGGHGGEFTTGTRRGVLHTTQTAILPGWEGNGPHFTIGRHGAPDPVPRPLELWQHFPVTVAAKTVLPIPGNPRPFQTNRHGAIQVEIIGCAAGVDEPRRKRHEANPKTAATALLELPGGQLMANLQFADPDLFRALGEWMRWVESTAGVERVTDQIFRQETEAAGKEAPGRLDKDGWLNSRGWVGHQHVPAPNDHWDPGAIDIAALLRVPPAGGAADWWTSPLALAGRRPTIQATRRRLDNRFPSLGFVVDSAGLPYFDVVLTTDAALLDPANAAARGPHNFYTSRQDGGLLGADESGGLYLVPPTVLRGFAQAQPPPTAIHYTVVAYADADGRGAVPADDPGVLARRAPSVEVTPGFQGHTLSRPRGVPLSMLRSRTAPLIAAGAAAPPRHPRLVQPAPARGTSVTPHDDSEEIGRGGHPGMEPSDSPSGQALAAGAVRSAVAPPPGRYDDGWGTWQPAPAARARSLDSTYRRGSAEPASLRPTGYRDEALETDELSADDLPWGHESYGPSPNGNGNGNGAARAPAPPSDGVPAYAPLDGAPQAGVPLDLLPATKRELVEAVLVGENDQLYSAINADGEFSGRFGPDHPAYQRWHRGLSYGIADVDQESGLLGTLLVMMHGREPAVFAEVFGPAAAELLAVTNAPGALSREVPGGRGARVQPVAGADLWEESWVKRFREAGDHPAFRAAQNELAAAVYLDPMLGFAADLGLTTPRALAMLLDRAVTLGVDGARHWVIDTVGSANTPALRQQALAALGHADIESFQRAHGLFVDGQFGPLTHAALIAALRLLAVAPIPVMAAEQMLDAMAARA